MAKKCNVCGCMIDDSDLVCPTCGASLEQKPKSKPANQTLQRIVKYSSMIETESLFNTVMYYKSILDDTSDEQDYNNVMALLTELAYKGHAESMYHLALMMLDNPKCNVEDAVKWLIISAKKGNENSRIKLSMLNNDYLVQQLSEVAEQEYDNVQGHYNVSSNKNIEFALKNIVRISKLVSETQGSSGTGFIIQGGYIVTNAHVVEGDYKSDIVVSFDPSIDDMKYKAKLLAIDEDKDIAILSFGGLMKDRIAKYEHFELELNETRFGDFVYTIGNSQGYGLRYSEGHIGSPRANAKHRSITDVICVDLDMQHGNSGGPLIDCNNRVVGITSFGITGHGVDELNYAIKSKYIIDVINKKCV